MNSDRISTNREGLTQQCISSFSPVRELRVEPSVSSTTPEDPSVVWTESAQASHSFDKAETSAMDQRRPPRFGLMSALSMRLS